MVNRHIKPAWIVETIEQPAWSETDPAHQGRTRSYKAIPALQDRILRVVHWREEADIVVLMVYPDRDALRRKRPS